VFAVGVDFNMIGEARSVRLRLMSQVSESGDAVAELELADGVQVVSLTVS
jgi:hypothetical protein